MKKQTLGTVLLTVLLAASLLLSGCSGGSKGNGAGSAGNAGAAQEAAANADATVEAAQEEVEMDAKAVALVKQQLSGEGLSKSELIKAMSKLSVHQADAELIISSLGVDFSIQALKKAVRLSGDKFKDAQIQKLLENSGYDASEITFAMENYKADNAASLIEEEMGKYALTDEELSLIGQ